MNSPAEDKDIAIGNKLFPIAVLCGAFLIIVVAGLAGHPNAPSQGAAIRGAQIIESSPAQSHWTGNGIDLVTRNDGYSDCSHLMAERGLRDGWNPAALALSGDRPVKGCMHIYGKYDRTWDGNQYSEQVFGFCPIEGGTLIETCLTIPPLHEAE